MGRNTVLLSGGLDSAVVLSLLQARGDAAEALFVDYGQHSRVEEAASAMAISRHFDVPLYRLVLGGVRPGDGEIPGRNLMLMSLALTMRGGAPGAILMGLHAGSPYWDCGEDFVNTAQRLLDGYSGGAVQMVVPFLHLNKADVHGMAVAGQVPISLTYSCERANGPCETCPSCREWAGLNAHPA